MTMTLKTFVLDAQEEYLKLTVWILHSEYIQGMKTTTAVVVALASAPDMMSSVIQNINAEKKLCSLVSAVW
jgi:hypothetical protein